MINQQSVLAVVVARGGSKGLPGKNIKPLLGKPLVAWTIEAALASNYIDYLMISTDDPDIAAQARAYGCNVPFLRPKELAQDDSPVEQVLLHALDTLPEKYDVIVLLQAAVPCRRADDIDKGIAQWASAPQRPLVSVVRSSKSPYWMYTLDSENMTPVIKSELNSARRQDHPEFYVLNGALYVMAVADFSEKKTYFLPETAAFIMEPEQSIDIDTELDFICAEAILRKQLENV